MKTLTTRQSTSTPTEYKLYETAREKHLRLFPFRLYGKQLFFIRKGPQLLFDGQSFAPEELLEILRGEY